MRPERRRLPRRRPSLTAEQIKDKVGQAFLEHLKAYDLPQDATAHLVNVLSQRLARKSRLGNAVLTEQLNLVAIFRKKRLEGVGDIIAVTLFPDGRVRIVRQEAKR